MFCVVVVSGVAYSLIVLYAIISSSISNSGDRSEDMSITGSDSSGALSLKTSNDEGAPLVEHPNSSLMCNYTSFFQVLDQIDRFHLGWPESCTMQFA